MAASIVGEGVQTEAAWDFRWKAGGVRWGGPSLEATLSPRVVERSQAGCKLCELGKLTWSLDSWREEAEAQWGRWTEVAECKD